MERGLAWSQPLRPYSKQLSRFQSIAGSRKRGWLAWASQHVATSASYYGSRDDGHMTKVGPVPFSLYISYLMLCNKLSQKLVVWNSNNHILYLKISRQEFTSGLFGTFQLRTSHEVETWCQMRKSSSEGLTRAGKYASKRGPSHAWQGGTGCWWEASVPLLTGPSAELTGILPAWLPTSQREQSKIPRTAEMTFVTQPQKSHHHFHHVPVVRNKTLSPTFIQVWEDWSPPFKERKTSVFPFTVLFPLMHHSAAEMESSSFTLFVPWPH